MCHHRSPKNFHHLSSISPQKDTSMTTKIFIIGGAGFIGSHLVAVCLEQGCQVWVYDNFSVGKKEFLPIHAALTIVEGDILNIPDLARAMQSAAPDVVYHLAAIHHIPTCEKFPEKALRVNVEGTKCVLTACSQSDIRRIVFASTGGVYDPVTVGPLSETSPIRPTDIYTISKVACEQLVQYHVKKEEGVQAVISRFFNTVGTRETNSHVIPAILAQLETGARDENGIRQVKLGNLHSYRDYVHVDDVAQALLHIGQMPMEAGWDVFNIGSGQEYSVQQVVDLFADVLGEPVQAISTADRLRKVDRPNQLADLTKIRQVTGWLPTRTLKQALQEVWEENLEKQTNHTPHP
jgi:UDP-glucose 4-epimerase